MLEAAGCRSARPDVSQPEPPSTAEAVQKPPLGARRRVPASRAGSRAAPRRRRRSEARRHATDRRRNPGSRARFEGTDECRTITRLSWVCRGRRRGGHQCGFENAGIGEGRLRRRRSARPRLRQDSKSKRITASAQAGTGAGSGSRRGLPTMMTHLGCAQGVGRRARDTPSDACGLGRAAVSAKGWVLAMLAA